MGQAPLIGDVYEKQTDPGHFLSLAQARSMTPIQMTPSEYYYGHFREDMASFWHSLNELGSVSRVRQRLTPSRFAHQAAEHFSVVDLVARPNRALPDHLASVPQERRIDFLCALLYTILIDQVIYSHHHADYPAFRALTMYPKMDRTVGLSRTLMMANPFELFEDDVLSSRGLNREDVVVRFAVWASFISSDLRAFFSGHPIGAINWPTVRGAILADPSATWGRAGQILTAALNTDESAS